MLILIVSSGPDKGRVYELPDHRDVVVGQAGDPVVLHDRKCARLHARLWCQGGRWYVEDLGSRHGTFRNRKPVQGRDALEEGDQLQVGGTSLVFARMNASFAERAALLGGIEEPTPRRGRKTKRLLIGAGALAAAVLVGLNVAAFLKATQANEQSERLQSRLDTGTNPIEPGQAADGQVAAVSRSTNTADREAHQPAASTPNSSVDVDALVAELAEKLDARVTEAAERLAQQRPPTAEELRALVRREIEARRPETEAAPPLLAPLAPKVVSPNASASLASEDATAEPEEDARLTRTERAYRRAFETGRTVTIGVGANGTPGRVLDPTHARENFEHWRDWYELDQRAHRLRLAREADRIRRQLNDPTIIALPDSGDATLDAPPDSTGSAAAP